MVLASDALNRLTAPIKRRSVEAPTTLQTKVSS